MTTSVTLRSPGRRLLGHRSARGVHERRGSGPVSRARSRLRRVAVPRRLLGGHLLGLLTAVIAVRSWYSPGRFVAAGDIGPFVRRGLAQDFGTAWGYGITGAGSVTAEVARLPEYVVYRVGTELGGSPMLAQQLFYVAVLCMASSGVVFAAKRCGAGPVARAAVAVLAIANPLLAVNLPNPLVPVAVGAVGFLLGCLLDVVRGRGSVAATAAATLPIAYLSINPPTAAVVVAVAAIAIAVAALTGSSARRRLWRSARWAVPLVAGLHAWWVVPAVVLHANGSGTAMVAVTDADAWSWTHLNNSIANVVTLTAHWGWGVHEYLPFSQDLDRFPVSVARWALPALVLMAPLVAASRRARRTSLVALVAAAPLVLVGKGLHGPATGLNRVLYDLPGMWLLREPMSKVGPVLLVAYLMAAAVALDGVVERTRARYGHSRPRVLAARSGVGMLAVAALVFGLPVLTGAVAPQERSPLPSSRVALPAGWTELAADLDADRTPGKVLVLPRLPFYQATTTWGFHGVATLPRDLFERPVMLDLPGGYFGEHAAVKQLVNGVEHGRSPALLRRGLDALGVSHVVVRRDLSDAQAVKPVADTDDLLDRLEGSRVFGPAEDYGVAVLLTVDDPRTGPSVHRPVAAPGTPADVGTAVLGMDATSAAVDAVGTAGAAAVLDGARRRDVGAVSVERGGRYQLEAAASAARSFRIAVASGALRLDDGLSLRVDGAPVAPAPPLLLPSPGDGAPSALLVDGRTVPVGPGDHIDLPVSGAVAALGAAGPAEPLAGWSPVGDCARSDDRRPALEATVETSHVRLFASAHAACVDAAPAHTGPMVISTHVEVRRGAGRMCLWSDAVQTCTWEQRFAPGSTVVSAALDVPADGRLFLYADAGAEPADVVYRDVALQRLTSGRLTTVPAALADPSLTVPAGEHEVVLNAAWSTDRLGAPSRVGNCHDRGDDPLLGGTWDGRTVSLRAGGGAACVYLPAEGIRPGVPYTVEFEYRTRNGMGRFCLWLEAERRCANDDQLLPAAASWQAHRSTVVLNEPSGEVRLYLYADAEDRPRPRTALNEYRDLRLRPAVPVSVSLLSSGERGPARLVGASGGGDRWELTVRPGGDDFVVSLPDSHHGGWSLAGVPDGTSAEPVLVDGFRQGWLIEGADRAALHLTAEFRPSGWVRAATGLSMGAAGLLVLLWGGRRVRSRLTSLSRPTRRCGVSGSVRGCACRSSA